MTDWTAKPYIAPNTLHVCDAFELLAALPDGSVDAIIVDPPYGMGHDSEWDSAIDVELFISEAWRVVKDGGFCAFFQQMPYAMDWLIPFHASDWKLKDHVVWVKRNMTAIALELCRMHESFYIYGKGKAKYHQTKGRYEDVKLPGVLVDVVTLEGIDRYIKDLRLKVRVADHDGRIDSNHHHSNYQYMKFASDRSPEFANFTNVWSFYPENKNTRNTGYFEHVSVKPVKFMERACELLAPENGLIVDCFLGSGTTAIAAKISGRNFICGDQSADYIEIAKRRVFPEFGKPPKRKREVKPLSDLPMFADLD